MPNDGKKTGLLRNPVGIQVTPLFQQGNTIVCELEPLAGDSSNVKAGIIKLKRGKTYELSFQLASGNPPGLLFAPNGMDAIWWDTNSCPTHSLHNGGGLSNPNVSADQSTLTVDVDPPAISGLVFYSLNFDNGGSFDPIIIHD